jgi:hypothetical protein
VTKTSGNIYGTTYRDAANLVDSVFNRTPVSHQNFVHAQNQSLSEAAGRGHPVKFLAMIVLLRYILGWVANILEWFDRKYAQTHYNKLHLLKSLTFFGDAEKDPMPHMLVPLDWDE